MKLLGVLFSRSFIIFSVYGSMSFTTRSQSLLGDARPQSKAQISYPYCIRDKMYSMLLNTKIEFSKCSACHLTDFNLISSTTPYLFKIHFVLFFHLTQAS
jgi:hypothetical protein